MTGTTSAFSPSVKTRSYVRAKEKLPQIKPSNYKSPGSSVGTD